MVLPVLRSLLYDIQFPTRRPISKSREKPSNYVNPVCCVATVCHQVRCIYWGHLGHFHGAIYHLKWYKIVCMRYLACTFSQMKSINMFSMHLQSGDLFQIEHRTSLFSCLCMSILAPNFSGNMQNHGYLGCFHAASVRENISGVWVIRTVP